MSDKGFHKGESKMVSFNDTVVPCNNTRVIYPCIWSRARTLISIAYTWWSSVWGVNVSTIDGMITTLTVPLWFNVVGRMQCELVSRVHIQVMQGKILINSISSFHSLMQLLYGAWYSRRHHKIFTSVFYNHFQSHWIHLGKNKDVRILVWVFSTNPGKQCDISASPCVCLIQNRLPMDMFH